MNPPLVKTTLTAPVSAHVGVATPTDTSRPTAATSITFALDFLIPTPQFFRPGPPRPKPACPNCALRSTLRRYSPDERRRAQLPAPNSGLQQPSSLSNNSQAFWIFFKLLTGGEPAFDHSHNGIDVVECSRMRIAFQMGNIEHHDPLMR